MVQFIIQVVGTLQINTKDNSGNTALHLASARNKDSIVILLLSNDADPSVKTNQNQTPYDLAIENNARGCIEILAPYYKVGIIIIIL